jgi:hypothetical protein
VSDGAHARDRRVGAPDRRARREARCREYKSTIPPGRGRPDGREHAEQRPSETLIGIRQ